MLWQGQKRQVNQLRLSEFKRVGRSKKQKLFRIILNFKKFTNELEIKTFRSHGFKLAKKPGKDFAKACNYLKINSNVCKNCKT